MERTQLMIFTFFDMITVDCWLSKVTVVIVATYVVWVVVDRELPKLSTMTPGGNPRDNDYSFRDDVSVNFSR
jgi:hypothetical protein